MNRKFLVQCILAASLSFAACGDDEDDGEGQGSPDASLGDAGLPDGGISGDAGAAEGGASCTTLTFQNFGMKVLTDNQCLLCHGSTPAANQLSLDTIDKIRAERQNIIDHAVEPRMDPKMPQNLPAIPSADQQKLKEWLNCGAP